VWPIAGWWSPNEYTAPVACPVAAACLGVNPVTAGVSNPNTNGAVDTMNCAAAYRGIECSQCKPGYYQLSFMCYSSVAPRYATQISCCPVACGLRVDVCFVCCASDFVFELPVVLHSLCVGAAMS
jgi:hypothetical protein